MSRLHTKLVRLNLSFFNSTQHCYSTVVNLSYKIIENATEASDNVPLFLLHDLLSNKYQWHGLGKIIHTLTKRSVVTLDLRNHGNSPHCSSNKYEELSADVEQLLKKLSVDRAYFIGHGIGGKVAMVTALMAPRKVAGIIVVDASPVSSPSQFNDVYSKIMKSMKALSFKDDKQLEIAKKKAKKHLKKIVNNDVTMDTVLSNLILKSDHTIGWCCNLDVLIKHFDEIISFPYFTAIKYNGPAFFVGGQFSKYLPPDDLISIRSLFPQAVITYIPSAGHNLQIDDPKSFLEMIIPLAKRRNGMGTVLFKRSFKFIIKSIFRYDNVRSSVNLAYKIHGDKKRVPPVLVLHGLLGSKRNWESLSKRIVEVINRTVIAVDARNHGESEHHQSHNYFDLASDVISLMDKLSIEQADFIGHSMGGRTAMVLALTEPSKISKLIVVDISPVSTASALNDFIPNLLRVMGTISFGGLDSLNSAKNHVRNKLLESKVIDADSMGFILMNVVSKPDKSFGWACNVDVLGKHFKDIATFPDMTGKVYTGPSLFVAGGNSPYVPPSDIDGIKKLFPKADLKYIPGAGHNVHAETPTEFVKIVTQFLMNK